MAEKITITQEQADAIERLKEGQRKDFEVYYKGNRERVVDWARPLSDLSTGEYISILYDGYEIEPKYKTGDWVANLDGSNIYPKGDAKVIEVGLVGEKYVRPVGNEAWGFPFYLVRHATPEEIKAEKERQKWSEIEEGDVLIGKKSGALATLVMEFPEHSEVKVRVDKHDFQTWDKESVELYAKKSVQPND